MSHSYHILLPYIFRVTCLYFPCSAVICGPIKAQTPSIAHSGKEDNILDPPPNYADIEPGKFKRRNSDLVRAALRGKSVVNRFKPSSSKGTVEENDETSKYPSFSQVVTSTMENMSKSIGDEKGSVSGDYNLSTFKMLWRNNLERIQACWDLNPDTVQHLKRELYTLYPLARVV